MIDISDRIAIHCSLYCGLGAVCGWIYQAPQGVRENWERGRKCWSFYHWHTCTTCCMNSFPMHSKERITLIAIGLLNNFPAGFQ